MTPLTNLGKLEKVIKENEEGKFIQTHTGLENISKQMFHELKIINSFKNDIQKAQYLSENNLKYHDLLEYLNSYLKSDGDYVCLEDIALTFYETFYNLNFEQIKNIFDRDYKALDTTHDKEENKMPNTTISHDKNFKYMIVNGVGYKNNKQKGCSSRIMWIKSHDGKNELLDLEIRDKKGEKDKQLNYVLEIEHLKGGHVSLNIKKLRVNHLYVPKMIMKQFRETIGNKIDKDQQYQPIFKSMDRINQYAH